MTKTTTALAPTDTVQRVKAKRRKQMPPKIIWDPERLRLDDVGNAKRFALEQRGRLLWCWDWECWLAWNGERWDRHGGQRKAHRAAKAVAKKIYREADAAHEKGDDSAADEIVKWAKQSHSSGKLSSMLNLAKSEPYMGVHANELDQDPYLLNCRNGTVDLRTGKLSRHNPKQKITKLAPVDYPAALGEIAPVDNGKMTLWRKCLRQWMQKDKAQLRYLKRLAGYCLTGITTSRVFPVFWGGGRNGKSTFLDTLTSLLGDYAGKAPETLLKLSPYDRHPTELADLEGLRLVVASETKSGMTLKTALVKEITGDQKLRARKMRQDFHEFPITCKVVLMTNSKPKIDEMTDAIWDRLHPLEWKYRVKSAEQDTHLLEKLKAEWPYILAWAVDGCLRWRKEGKLSPTPDMVAGIRSYRAQENPVADFLADCTRKKQGAIVPVEALWEEYQKWAGKHKDRRRLSKGELGQAMRQLGYEVKSQRIDGKVKKVRVGLELKTPVTT